MCTNVEPDAVKHAYMTLSPIWPGVAFCHDFCTLCAYGKDQHLLPSFTVQNNNVNTPTYADAYLSTGGLAEKARLLKYPQT